MFGIFGENGVCSWDLKKLLLIWFKGFGQKKKGKLCGNGSFSCGLEHLIGEEFSYLQWCLFVFGCLLV